MRTLAGLFATAAALYSQQLLQSVPIAALPNGPRFVSFQADQASGVAILNAGAASAAQARPCQLEFYAAGQIEEKAAGYNTFTYSHAKAAGTATLAGPNGTRLTCRDSWSIEGNVIELSRTVQVSGTSPGGFLSAITFSHPEQHPRTAVEYFAPGLIYGTTAHLSPASIGGQSTYENGGNGQVRIREDRLPAPLFGVRFEDQWSLTVLDPAPNGATSSADAQDTEVQLLTDEHFQFGAVGVDLANGHHAQGFWFPGSEGEVTYRGNTYPGGQVHTWRRRYHPIRDGFEQHYRVQFRVSRDQNFPAYLKTAWRWAYATLKPAVNWQDIPLARRSMLDMLAAQVQFRGDWAGIPNAIAAAPGSNRAPSQQAIMGFTGKNLEAAEYLLADAEIDTDPARAARDRSAGLAIFASFTKLRLNPPVGEGFNLETGRPALAIPRDRCVFLRSFSDDGKATLRARRREQQHGHPHPEWLAWAQTFGDWLLTQQSAAGGFPRSWEPVTGKVVDESPQSSYNPVPFLVLLSAATADRKYLQAAERAADFVWSDGQSNGAFVGGTIDNPDVLDKEAGTLSLEAYLALYGATHEAKWLARAQAAADYAETWIYLWNVPMPIDTPNSSLDWKQAVPTAGTQLIATGHSLVDEYMAFDVDEYAELSRLTGDARDNSVSRLLLHNTKAMLALPGRTFDLNGPGWQQEHFSFAPVRGRGLHRLWLPWVATAQLNGIFELMELDPILFKQWTTPAIH